MNSSTPIRSSRLGSDVGADLHLVDEVREQTTDVMDPKATEPFGVYVWTAGQPAATLAQYVERFVFEKSFGNTPALLDTEYARVRGFEPLPVRHRSCSTLAGRDGTGDLAVRRGLQEPQRHRARLGQSAEDLAARVGFALRSELVWDCATLAAMPEYRRGATQGVVGMALYQTLATASIRNGFRWWVAIIDAPVLRLLQWRLGRPFETYEGVPAMPYLGSEASIPVWSDLPAWKARLVGSAPVAHDLIFGGRGIADAVAPPDWDAVEGLIGGRSRRRILTGSAPTGPRERSA